MDRNGIAVVRLCKAVELDFIMCQLSVSFYNCIHWSYAALCIPGNLELMTFSEDSRIVQQHW